MSKREEGVNVEALVKQRARELRGTEPSYSKVVRALAEELYDTAREKETRLAELGVTRELVVPLLGSGDATGASIAKTKKARAKIVGTLETEVSPWVSDVYEEAPED